MSYEVCVWNNHQGLESKPAHLVYESILDSSFEDDYYSRAKIYQFVQRITAVFPQNDDIEDDFITPVWADEFVIGDSYVLMTCLYQNLNEVLEEVRNASRLAGLAFYDPQTDLLINSGAVEITVSESQENIEKFFLRNQSWHKFLSSDLGRKVRKINTGDPIGDSLEMMHLLKPLADEGNGAAQRMLGFCYCFLGGLENELEKKRAFYKSAYHYLVESLNKVSGQKALLRNLEFRAEYENIDLT